MELVINDELLRKCGSGSSEYWFSYRNYNILSISELRDMEKPADMGQTEFYVSMGIIPFVSVSNEEIMRAFVKMKGSAKLNAVLQKVHSEDFIETFWKYFNAYTELKEGLDEFANDFIINKVSEWCEENNINYKIAK